MVEFMRASPGHDGASDSFKRGMLVRLIGDPQSYGAFQDAIVRAGRSFARVQRPCRNFREPNDSSTRPNVESDVEDMGNRSAR